jgi:hypothetical protein
MDLQALREFPASLQRLVVEDIHELQSHHRDWIQLGHLTALTELDLGGAAAQGVYIQGDDEALPPSLIRLHGKWGEAEALKGLSSLRHLGGPYHVDELLELADAGVAAQLTHVGLLHYCYHPEPDGSDEEGEDDGRDGGLGCVVKQLTDAGLAGAVRSVLLFSDFEDDDAPDLGPAMLALLQQLSVQSLQLVDIDYRLRDLAVLTQLSRLDVSVVYEFAPNQYAFDYDALPTELLSLPSLRELVMPTPHPQSHAAWAANDAFVARVAQSSPQLRVVHAGLYA